MAGECKHCGQVTREGSEHLSVHVYTWGSGTHGVQHPHSAVCKCGEHLLHEPPPSAPPDCTCGRAWEGHPEPRYAHNGYVRLYDNPGEATVAWDDDVPASAPRSTDA